MTPPAARVLAIAISILPILAGCVAPPAATEPPPAADSLVPGFAQDHDHLDPSLHAFSHGLDAVGYHNLVPGSDGRDAAARGDWVNSEVIVRGDHAYVGYLGAPWLFAIVNVSDAAAPVLESAFPTSNAWCMDVAVSDDGDWVFASVYVGQTLGPVLSPQYLLREPEAPEGYAAPGVLVVDARDRANPVATGFLPIHGLGPHTAVYHRYPDGREVVFANKADPVAGNAVVIAEVVDAPTGGRTLEPLGVFAVPSVSRFAQPHDLDVQEHPITGQTLLSIAYFGVGLVTVDATDPADPTIVSVFDDFDDEDGTNLHDAHPAPALAGGRHYTFSAPEHAAHENTGYLRVYDTTDPAAPSLVGRWQLPGDYVVQAFDLTPHNFEFLPDGRIVLAHGHAGVWVIDWLGPGGLTTPDPARIAAPVATAYHVPAPAGAAPPSWSPVHGTPWAWGVGVDARGLVWASDTSSGLHGLRVGA